MIRAVDRDTRKEMLRLLHGELTSDRADELRRRIATDPSLSAAFHQMQAAWDGLDLAAPPEAPPGFAARMTAIAFEADTGMAPAWFRDTLLGRVATATTLAAGIAIGVILAYPQEGSAEWVDVFADEPSLAESYWQAFEESDETIWAEEVP